MTELSEYLQKIFASMASQIPGFISITLLKSDDGTLMASYPPESKRALELISPFHLEIYKGASKSLDMEGDSDMIREILITTQRRMYVIACRSQIAVGVLTLDVNKANLGLTRKLSDKVGDEIYNFLKQSGVFSPK